MKEYSPTGRRNHGRPLKRLLDTWDQNPSTSGPTPWQIDDDDDNDDDFDKIWVGQGPQQETNVISKKEAGLSLWSLKRNFQYIWIEIYFVPHWEYQFHL
jgi:hypothetical protein